MSQMIDAPASKCKSTKLHEVGRILNKLREACLMIEHLLENMTTDSLDEAHVGPLSADQLKKRNDRDIKRREKITKINADSVAKTIEIRKDFGK